MPRYQFNVQPPGSPVGIVIRVDAANEADALERAKQALEDNSDETEGVTITDDRNDEDEVRVYFYPEALAGVPVEEVEDDEDA